MYHLQTIYREANSYHNFEHAIDVFQALYHFLSQVGVVRDVQSLLSEQPREAPLVVARPPSLLDILEKEDILVLCIAAVGHDVGHPGLTNAFMVMLLLTFYSVPCSLTSLTQKNAQTPLSVVYDDKSALEQMHYTLLLQVMRHSGLGHLLDGPTSQQTPTASAGCKKLLLSIILVTDLSVHDQFMQDFAELIEHDTIPSDPLRAKTLACQALIKAADISNPVGTFSAYLVAYLILFR